MSLTHSDDGSRSQTRTGDQGCFHFARLRSAGYHLRVLAEGFGAYDTDVTLEGRLDLDDIVLEIQPIRSAVLVTATRTPTPSAVLGSSVDVIDRIQIEASRTRVVSDVLRDVAGINVARTGNRGGLTTLFVRGGESDHTKILIDGIPVNQPGGTYDFSHIPTDNISRIEVVRGPQSAVFGSDAMAGVVQLFTRPGEGSPQIDYSIEGGSFANFAQRTGVRGAWRKLDFSNTFSRFDTDNIGRNNDYRNASYFGNFGFTPGSRQSLRGTLSHSSVKAGAPGATAPGFTSSGPDNRLQRLERGGGLTYLALVGSRMTQHVAYRLYDHDFTFFSAFGTSRILDTRHRIEYHGEVAMTAGSLLAYGIDFDLERALVADRRRTRDNYGYYVQQQFTLLNRLDVTAGFRVEDNANFGTKTNPRLALSLRPLPASRVRFSAGTGIKAPNFTEHFSETPSFLGNPTLLPEQSRSWDFGFEQSFWRERVLADVTWFDNRFQNMIELVRRPDGSRRFENVGLTRALGLEVRTRAIVRALRAQMNYTFLEGQIEESLQQSFPFRLGDPLLRRPKHSASFSLVWTAPRWTAHWTTRYVGRRADSDFFAFSRPLTSNPAYAVSDAAFTYEIGRHASAFVRLENVFNRSYQEVLGYQALRRGAIFGMQVRFGGAG